MYDYLSLYFARDCKSNKSRSHKSIMFDTVYGLRENLFLTGLCIVFVFVF